MVETLEPDIKEMVADLAGLSKDKIRDDSKLISDLGLDSLDFFEILNRLDRHLDVPGDAFGEFDNDMTFKEFEGMIHAISQP